MNHAIHLNQADRLSKIWGPPLQIATFRADVTPAVGEPMINARDGVVKTIEHPLAAKGVLLRNRDGVCVLCAIDECGICNEAHDRLRAALASAAGTTPDRVAVQTLHQHTADILDTAVQRYMAAAPGSPPIYGESRLKDLSDKIAAAIQAAASSWQRLTNIGTSWAPVDRLASNRRVQLPDGRFVVRYSAATDPLLQQAPEGLIDGYLRTVSFRAGDKTVAQLHYYASHPQSYYGDGRITWDVPGLAREAIEKDTGIHQVYFTGCSGQITFGKYNDGQPQTRPKLVQRLRDAMELSRRQITWQPADDMDWRVEPMHFEARHDARFTPAECQTVLADPTKSGGEQFLAASLLAWHDRIAGGAAVELSRLAIGPISIVHLPGEPFVQYQLWAQQCRPDRFVCVAGYGDCGMWYVPTDAAYGETGAYEQTWAFAAPCEQPLKNTIARLLSR
jgi:hypothetical protein